MTALAVLGVIVAYFTAGYRYAQHTAPEDARRAAESWSSRSTRRESFTARQVCSHLFWPTKAVWFAVSDVGNAKWEQHDPESVARRERESHRRIAELERELGIKRDAA